MNSKNLILAAATTTLLLSGAAHAGAGCSSYSSGARTAAMHHGGYDRPARYMPAGYGYHQAKPASHQTKPVAQDPVGDIVDIAVSAGSFTTLVTAVKAAGLVDTLKGKGPFTVFAPTDAAFAKLPEGTLEALLADRTKLTQILTYHVVPGKLDSSAVTGVSRLSTVEGSELAVADIKIAKTDIMADNGVIHVIDEVLIPGS